MAGSCHFDHGWIGQKPLTVAWRELGGNGMNGHL